MKQKYTPILFVYDAWISCTLPVHSELWWCARIWKRELHMTLVIRARIIKHELLLLLVFRDNIQIMKEFVFSVLTIIPGNQRSCVGIIYWWRNLKAAGKDRLVSCITKRSNWAYKTVFSLKVGYFLVLNWFLFFFLAKKWNWRMQNMVKMENKWRKKLKIIRTDVMNTGNIRNRSGNYTYTYIYIHKYT